MEGGRRLSLTAVFLKRDFGYTGYVVELRGVNSHGRTLEEARRILEELVSLVFEEERRIVLGNLAGKEIQREAFFFAG